jgi:hypothetical protein
MLAGKLTSWVGRALTTRSVIFDCGKFQGSDSGSTPGQKMKKLDGYKRARERRAL